MQHPTEKEAIAVPDRLERNGHVTADQIQTELAQVRSGIHEDTHARVETAAPVDAQRRELKPAQIEQIVRTITENFSGNSRELPKLHPNIQWADVEIALRANPTLLFGLFKMEETGGVVDVIEEDDGSFLFGDTSRESPEGRRNVVFDRAAEDYLREYFPQERCNGNAADRVQEWGVDFMDGTQYRTMQEQDNRFDAETLSWLKTLSDMREAGYALDGNRYGGYVTLALRKRRTITVATGVSAAC